MRRPAVYELTEKKGLSQVLELAGGIMPTAYLQKVQVERVEAHSQKVVLDLDLRAENTQLPDIANFTLQDRDLVKVSAIASSGGFVTLKGYVTRPGVYQLTPGMHLADLVLAYDNLLPEYYPGLVQIIRVKPPLYRQESLTVDLDKALKGDAIHNILLQEYDEVRLFSRTEMEEIPQVVVSGAVLNPGEYQLFDKMRATTKNTAASRENRRQKTAVARSLRHGRAQSRSSSASP